MNNNRNLSRHRQYYQRQQRNQFVPFFGSSWVRKDAQSPQMFNIFHINILPALLGHTVALCFALVWQLRFTVSSFSLLCLVFHLIPHLAVFNWYQHEKCSILAENKTIVWTIIYRLCLGQQPGSLSHFLPFPPLLQEVLWVRGCSASDNQAGHGGRRGQALGPLPCLLWRQYLWGHCL